MISNRAWFIKNSLVLALALTPLTAGAQELPPTPEATPSEVLGRPSAVPLSFGAEVEETLRQEEQLAAPGRTPLYLKVKVTHGTEMSARFFLKRTSAEGITETVQVGSVAPFPRRKPTDPPAEPVIYTVPVAEGKAGEVLSILEGCGTPMTEGVPVRKIGEPREQSRSRFRVLEATLTQ